MHRIYRFLFVLSVVLLVGIGASGAQDFPPVIPDDVEVTITYYNYNLASAGLGADATQQLLNEFMELHPNITVEGVGVASNEGLSRITADIAAGMPPDVAQIVFNDLSFVVENEIAVPLEDIVPPDELAAHLEGMNPRGIALGQLDGKTWGLAYTFSTPVLFYNADLFREAGLDPDMPPTNWEQVQEYALAIVENTDADGFFPLAYGVGFGDWVFEALVRSAGGRILSEDRTTVTFGEQPGIDAVTMLHNLYASGAHPDMTFADSIPAFTGGSLAMNLTSSVLQSTYLSASEGNFELRAAAMPGFGDNLAVPVNSGSANFILARDPLKQRAAWELMKFLSSERGYTVITSQIGYLPLRPSIVNDPNFLGPWVEEHPLILPNLEQLERLEPWTSFPGPNYRQISEIMMEAVETAVFEGGDIAQIMQDAQARGQELMP